MGHPARPGTGVRRLLTPAAEWLCGADALVRESVQQMERAERSCGAYALVRGRSLMFYIFLAIPAPRAAVPTQKGRRIPEQRDHHAGPEVTITAGSALFSHRHPVESALASLYGRSAKRLASRKISINIGRVSLPVCVFWFEGWYEAMSTRPSGRTYSAPWRNSCSRLLAITFFRIR